MQFLQSGIFNSFNGLGASFSGVWPNVPRALVIAIIGYIVMRILAVFFRRAISWTHWPIGLQQIMVTLVRIALWLFLVITVLQILGLSSVALAITGSFAILLIGFSQGIAGTVSDLMAGLQISGDKDFKVGYRVRAGDKQTEGVVREMDIKKTRIEDDDGKLHVIPNSAIEKNEWIVLERHVHSKMPLSTGIMKATADSARKLRKKVSK